MRSLGVGRFGYVLCRRAGRVFSSPSPATVLNVSHHTTVHIELLVDHPKWKRAGNPRRCQHDVVNPVKLSRVSGALRFRNQVEHLRRRIVKVGCVDVQDSTISDGQNCQGLSLQLDGSAPIFSPRSAKLFMVSFLNTPGTGGDQSGGMDTTRTSTSALRLSSEISAIAKRCLIAVAVAARVDVSRLR